MYAQKITSIARLTLKINRRLHELPLTSSMFSDTGQKSKFIKVTKTSLKTKETILKSTSKKQNMKRTFKLKLRQSLLKIRNLLNNVCLPFPFY